VVLLLMMLVMLLMLLLLMPVMIPALTIRAFFRYLKSSAVLQLPA